MTVYIESLPPHAFGQKERLMVRAFPDNSAMHRFLDTGDNALRWRECTKGLKAGTYAFAGGKWHNVKTLDPMLLAHI